MQKKRKFSAGTHKTQTFRCKFQVNNRKSTAATHKEQNGELQVARKKKQKILSSNTKRTKIMVPSSSQKTEKS
jgi:hypothetical protein